MMRLIASIVVVALASASMGVATYAHFSDREQVTGTPLVSGTMDLVLGGTAGFQTGLGASAFAPDDRVSGALTLTDAGTVPAVLDWKAVVTKSDRQGGTTDLARYLVLTELVYRDDDHLSAADGGVAIQNRNGNGWIDLDDLAQTGPVTGLQAPSKDGSAFSVAVWFHPSAGNALQGDTVSLDLVFHLRQAGGPALE